MLHELPLVIFTVMAQMCVGAFVTLGAIHVLGARVDAKTMDRVSDPALYALGPLLVLGLAASTLHLGSPLRAVNALRHVGTSWLSNEIITGMLFLGAGAAFAGAQFFKIGSARMRQALAMLASLIGLFLVYCISRVYSLRTVPAWDTPFTALRFYVTALLLGGLAVGAALVLAAGWRRRRGLGDEAGDLLVLRSIRGIAISSGVLLGAKFVGVPLYLAYLGTHADNAAHESLRVLGDTHVGWSFAAYTLTFLGIAALGYLLVRLSKGPVGQRLVLNVAVCAFVFVFAGEFIGRMLFYASMVRTGL
ncbi:dimethyl sulfoxide reductase anchor subunit family protein [Gephyromycinifex aptenodytis]|uniref:dimethyl sulfoxide reductase anchor subunit family protein n=1 Tax=Gephyromycinifex aptenodytis TaxID=2716227 RepID=UPI001444BEA8|nr:DmsC/YnfH family molybdoenzyme membrane anchor subunit [Gephyromycinifex aptenodytis]